MFQSLETFARLTVMPIGDEITTGKETDGGGYRLRLYWKLDALGYDVDFVGTQSNLQKSAPLLPQRKHEGHVKATIQDFINNIEGYLSKVGYPDVILLNVGSVDFTLGDDIKHAINRFEDLLIKLSNLRPLSLIIATTLLPRNEPFNKQINTYFNPFVENVAKKLKKGGKRIEFLDMFSVVPRGQVRSSHIPKGPGYESMATAFTSAIFAFIPPSLNDRNNW